MENNVQEIFFYWIHYPSTEPWDCWWENDIKCFSRTRQIVEDEWHKYEVDIEEELSDHDNRIDEFQCDIPITSDTVWIIFSYDAEDPDWARIKFVGNSREECLVWWNENWIDYIDYDPEEEEEAPSFEERWGDSKFGLLMKEMKIA